MGQEPDLAQIPQILILQRLPHHVCGDINPGNPPALFPWNDIPDGQIMDTSTLNLAQIPRSSVVGDGIYSPGRGNMDIPQHPALLGKPLQLQRFPLGHKPHLTIPGYSNLGIAPGTGEAQG